MYVLGEEDTEALQPSKCMSMCVLSLWVKCSEYL